MRDETFQKIEKHYCCNGCYILSAILVAFIMLALWKLFNLMICFDDLKDFLTICIQFIVILAIILAIVAVRLDLYKKYPKDQKDILDNTRSLFQRSILYFSVILLFLFIVLILRQIYNIPYFYYFVIVIISFVVYFLYNILCSFLSYANNLRGPQVDIKKAKKIMNMKMKK